MDTWILLRIPRTEGAKTMSGVLVSGDVSVTAVGSAIPAVCDELLARAEGRAQGNVTLIVPLDGRHGLAHVVLEESQRRGWSFSRHVPPGSEAYLLDLDGPDAAPDTTDVSKLFDDLTEQVKTSIQDSELGEALAGLRHLLTVTLRHLGAWHPDTLWAASNLLHIASATGAQQNTAQANGLVEHLLSQPMPETFTNPMGVLRKLEEVARRCAQAGFAPTAVRCMESSIEVARRVFGEGHINHLATQNNTCQLLVALRSPKAEDSLRALLKTARTTLGERHANVAVVLSNLADVLDAKGQTDEANTLREEAASIRASAS